MQLLPRLSDDPRAFAREQSAGSRLPYSHHLDPWTIETRDGLLMQTIHLAGFLFETADADELNHRKRLREATLQAVGSSRFALYHHIVRRRVRPVDGGAFPDAFSRRLDNVWNERLSRRRLYANDLYITLIRRPAPARALGGLLERFGARAGAADPTVSIAERRELDAAREALMAGLEAYRPGLLQIYPTPQGLCSEPLEFLSELYNARRGPILLPDGDLGEHLPARRVSFGQDTLELARTGESASVFAGLVSVKNYPGQTTPGMLDDLLRLPCEMVVSQSFGFVDRQVALGRMNLALRRMRAADDEALSLRADLTLAKDEVAAGRTVFGEHHLTVMVRDADPEGVNQGVADVQAALTNLGLIGVREDLALEPAFWAQFPGNFRFIARRALVSSRNFAAFASGHNFPRGQALDNHWGPAVCTLETTAAGPYAFNFHRGDLGNFTVIGPSGSGKTVVLNFLLAQARRFDPRIVFFDKDRGAELFIRAIGGGYDVLRPGVTSGLNPLQMEDSAENRNFLAAWLAQLTRTNDDTVAIEDLVRIREAIEANFSIAPEHRRLRHLAELFRGAERPHTRDLWSRLRAWWGDGEHAWLFDGPEDSLDLDRHAVGFDMTRLLDDPVLRTPAMMYLFHRIEQRLDGAPAIIVIDEGWKALDDDVFVEQIRDWEKTIRKRNGVVGFATQSAEDALRSRIAAAIVEQAATQIFMANAQARADDYMGGFGLSAHEFELVRTLPEAARCFLIKHGQDSVVARLDLSGETDLLTILSGRESTVRRLDALRTEVGDDPADWLPRLLAEAG